MAFARARALGAGGAGDGERFLRFFRAYVGGWHHAREEGVLFPALVTEASLPGDRGPVAALVGQHHDLAALLDALAPLLRAPGLSPDEAMRTADLATRYARGLWAHIDAENSVLLPESAERLLRAGIRELESRMPSPEEDDVADDGVALAAAYPPVHDPGAFRGDGCVVCASFGTTCDGVEREWWSDSEWDEFPHRVG